MWKQSVSVFSIAPVTPFTSSVDYPDWLGVLMTHLQLQGLQDTVEFDVAPEGMDVNIWQHDQDRAKSYVYSSLSPADRTRFRKHYNGSVRSYLAAIHEK